MHVFLGVYSARLQKQQSGSRNERTNEKTPQIWMLKLWYPMLKRLIHVANLLALNLFGKNTCSPTSICRRMVDGLDHTIGKVTVWPRNEGIHSKSWCWMPNTCRQHFFVKIVCCLALLNSNKCGLYFCHSSAAKLSPLLSACLLVYMYWTAGPSTHPSVHLSLCMSVDLFVYLSVSLSVF